MTILDVTLSLEQTSYLVSEEVGVVQVCAAIVGGDLVPGLSVEATISTSDGSACEYIGCVWYI